MEKKFTTIKHPTSPEPQPFVTLHVPQTFDGAPWLGWNIVFGNTVTPNMILAQKPFLESRLNKYLQDNVDVAGNRLVTPFNCAMEATSNPLVYDFKVQVFTLDASGSQVPFNYPQEPIIRRDGDTLTAIIPSLSHVSTVPVKKPAL